MATHGEPVVGGVDDVGILSMRAVFHGLHDAADLFVEVGDQPVVLAELVTDDFLGAWPSGKPFVAPHHCLRAILERVQGEEVFGKGRAFVVVDLPVFLRRIARIMRRGEGDVEEERLLGIGGLDKVDRGVRKQLAGELLARQYFWSGLLCQAAVASALA